MLFEKFYSQLPHFSWTFFPCLPEISPLKFLSSWVFFFKSLSGIRFLVAPTVLVDGWKNTSSGRNGFSCFCSCAVVLYPFLFVLTICPSAKNYKTSQEFNCRLASNVTGVSFSTTVELRHALATWRLPCWCQILEEKLIKQEKRWIKDAILILYTCVLKLISI